MLYAFKKTQDKDNIGIFVLGTENNYSRKKHPSSNKMTYTFWLIYIAANTAI